MRGSNMFCPQCGNQISENNKFCMACGCKIEAKSEKSSKPIPKNIITYISVGVLVLIIIVLVVVIVRTKRAYDIANIISYEEEDSNEEEDESPLSEFAGKKSDNSAETTGVTFMNPNAIEYRPDEENPADGFEVKPADETETNSTDNPADDSTYVPNDEIAPECDVYDDVQVDTDRESIDSWVDSVAHKVAVGEYQRIKIIGAPVDTDTYYDDNMYMTYAKCESDGSTREYFYRRNGNVLSLDYIRFVSDVSDFRFYFYYEASGATDHFDVVDADGNVYYNGEGAASERISACWNEYIVSEIVYLAEH